MQQGEREELHNAIHAKKDCKELERLVLKDSQLINTQADIAFQDVEKRSTTGLHQVTINKEGVTQATALHVAILRGDIDVIELLLANGADPSLTCSYHHKTVSGPYGSQSSSVSIGKANALHLAIFCGNVEAAVAILAASNNQAKSLIEAKISHYSRSSSKSSPDTGCSNSTSIEGANALHLAFFSGASLRVLPSKDKATKPSSKAIAGDQDIFEHMLTFAPAPDDGLATYEEGYSQEGGFDSSSDKTIYHNLTPLHLAGIRSKRGWMNALLQAGVGANPNALFTAETQKTSWRDGEDYFDFGGDDDDDDGGKEKDKKKKGKQEEPMINRSIAILHWMLSSNGYLGTDYIELLIGAGANPYLMVDTLLIAEIAGDTSKFKQPAARQIDFFGIAHAFSFDVPQVAKIERSKCEEEKEQGTEKEKEKGEQRKRRFKVGNTATQVEGEGEKVKWRWKMFVEGETEKDQKAIESVTFDLHPTFKPPTVQVTEAPFELMRTGWGTFMVTVHITTKKTGLLRRQKVFDIQHQLDFDKEESSAVHEF